MNKEILKQKIELHFKNKRAFVKAIGDGLDESVLSKQLAGKRGLSKAWKLAYVYFFKYWELKYKK